MQWAWTQGAVEVPCAAFQTALALSACEVGQSLWDSINKKGYLREDKQGSQINSLIQGPGNFFLYNDKIKTM